MSTNILGVMEQLRDAQDKVRRAENRCQLLTQENERLSQELRKARMESIVPRSVRSTDDLVAELQVQLAAALSRNADLEARFHHSGISSQDLASPQRKKLL